MAKDYNKLLYGKVAQEHDDFIDELKTKPPEQIIEASYEKVIKDDLLSIFEYTNFPQTEVRLCISSISRLTRSIRSGFTTIYPIWICSEIR